MSRRLRNLHSMLLVVTISSSLYAMDSEPELVAEEDYIDLRMKADLSHAAQVEALGLSSDAVASSDASHRKASADITEQERAEASKNFARAQKLFDAGMYVKAHEYLLPLAAQLSDVEINAWAQIYLAILYYVGRGVARDLNEAHRYAEMANYLAKEAVDLYEIVLLSKILTDKQLDINGADENGWTVFHRSAKEGLSVVMRLILALGADINQPIATYKGSDPRAFMHIYDGDTALHLAAWHGQLGVIKLLLTHHAKVNISNKNGYTPLHCAASVSDNTQAVQLLLDAGADVKAVTLLGVTPLHEAAHRNNRVAVARFLDKGALINAKTNNGSTPLHKAAAEGHDDVVTILLARGADIYAEAVMMRVKKTPLQLAQAKGRKAVIELLKKAESDI